MMKPWIITGLCCVGAGLIFCTAGISVGALSQNRLAKKLNLTDVTTTPDATFSTVLLDTQRANVIIKSGDTASITAENIDTDHYSVDVQDGMLEIRQNYQWSESWYQWVQIGSLGVPTAKITVTLPEAEYRAIAVSTGAGDCTIQNICASTLSLDTDCGKCSISGVTTDSCTVDNDAGDLCISDSTIDGTMLLSADCGTIQLEQLSIGRVCDIEAVAGDVSMTNVTYGSAEFQLSCGGLSMQDCTETDQDTNSTFALDAGDISLQNSTLYQPIFALCAGECTVRSSTLTGTSFSIDYGDLTVKDTALYGNSTIKSDAGDIDLNLRGTESDYTVLTSIAGNAGQSDKNTISIDTEEYVSDVSVSFTD